MKLEMPPFQQAKLLVVGDVMLDRYWHGAAHRVSPEAPVPVVQVGNQEDRPGGAGNVALNIAALGSAATLVGIVGTDDTGSDVFSRLVAATGLDLVIGLTSVAGAFIAGVVLGAVVGYSRSWWPPAVMWLMDFLQSFPVPSQVACSSDDRRRWIN